MSSVDQPLGLTCTFEAEQFCFVVATSAVEDTLIVERLFHDLRSTPAVPADLAVFSFTRSGTPEIDETWTITGPGTGAHTTDSLSAGLGWLRAAVNIASLDAARGQLHLHAAAASRSHQAVVIAAPRNTGKTTTVTALLARGWSFITDETVVLSRDDDHVRGIPKPLSIKPEGVSLPEAFRAHAFPTPEDGSSLQFVSIGLAGVPVVPDAIPHLVVMLRRAVVEAPAASWTRLHPADAVVGLMQETLDAGRFGRDATVRLAKLTAASHCAEVLRGHPDATADLIARLASAGPNEAVAVDVYPPSDRLNPQVSSVRIGDRAVIHHHESGQVLALDSTATRIWEQVAGWDHHLDIDLGDTVIRAFTSQLQSFDLILHRDARTSER